MGSDNSSSNFPPAGPTKDGPKAPEKTMEENGSAGKEGCRIIPFRRNR
jgi:hypothetical protein